MSPDLLNRISNHLLGIVDDVQDLRCVRHLVLGEIKGS